MARKPATPETVPPVPEPAAATAATTEAKSRFNAALDEAKAGAAALKGEAKSRAGALAGQARASGEEWAADAKVKAADLAQEGKSKASEGIAALSRVVDENAPLIDEKLGPKYGDYARTASRTLADAATSLNDKSFEELGEGAKEVIRKNPVASVGIAALAGLLLARLFRRN